MLYYGPTVILLLPSRGVFSVVSARCHDRSDGISVHLLETSTIEKSLPNTAMLSFKISVFKEACCVHVASILYLVFHESSLQSASIAYCQTQTRRIYKIFVCICWLCAMTWTTDIYINSFARGFGLPVLHVNGDDPVAVTSAFQLAAEWRQTWATDAIALVLPM